MCGIVGYIGPRVAPPLLLEGLKRLEYRGYDSAGIAVVHGTAGIAHTRWATHGAPNWCNAHPHIDCENTIAVVHNGIVENGATLRQALEDVGHTFRSETDTEVLAHLIEEFFDGNLEQAVIAALGKVEGTYGIAVVSSRDPDKIVAARKGSALLLRLGDGEFYVASDAS